MKKIFTIVLSLFCVFMFSNICFSFDFSAAEIGDEILFGTYRQSSYSPEEIEWIVLDKDDEKMLLISKYALDTKPFNSSWRVFLAEWENCSLRTWLNEDFMNTAFSSSEKQRIIQTSHRDIDDYVFLLSSSEAREYFDSATQRQCYPTEYARNNGAWISSDNRKCCWWLRTSERVGYATTVNAVGDLHSDLESVSTNDICVRPAIWISVS